MIIEKHLEMRGMPKSEIIDYFIKLNSLVLGEGIFIYQNCEVKVSEEKSVYIGSLQFPSTMVTFRGEKDSLEKIISAFRIKFLSAGG